MKGNNNRKYKYLLAFWNSFLNSFRLFRKHDTLTLGAALSYYTGFSLIPIIIIVMSISGSILGEQAVKGEIYAQLQDLLGNRNAEQLQGLVRAVYIPGRSTVATILAILLLMIGATSVFSQLHTSLNLIWNIKERARQPVLRFLITRLFSFAMIVCLSFLLLVSFVVNAALSAFSKYLNYHLHDTSVIVLTALDFLISYGFTTLLFGLIYKYMSEAKPPWKNIWPGALFTAFLFVIGKYLMGLYFGTFNFDDSYGAAGSMVVLLTWVFYSSQIVFFGAEFTHALAAEHGVLLDPNAIMHNADSGMKHTHTLQSYRKAANNGNK